MNNRALGPTHTAQTAFKLITNNTLLLCAAWPRRIFGLGCASIFLIDSHITVLAMAPSAFGLVAFLASATTHDLGTVAYIVTFFFAVCVGFQNAFVIKNVSCVQKQQLAPSLHVLGWFRTYFKVMFDTPNNMTCISLENWKHKAKMKCGLFLNTRWRCTFLENNFRFDK